MITDEINLIQEKREFIKLLNNHKKPEMISFTQDSENDKLAIMQTISKRIEMYRLKTLGEEKYSTGVLYEFVRSNLALRRSINGEGSRQITQVIGKVLDEENAMRGKIPSKQINI